MKKIESVEIDKKAKKITRVNEKKTAVKKQAGKPLRTKQIVILSLAALVIIAAAVLYVVFQNDIAYAIADAKLGSGNDEDAREIFLELSDFKDSNDRVLQIDYSNACRLMDKGEYESAILNFEALGNYSDCPEKITQCHKLFGEELYETGNYKNSAMHFEMADYEEGAKKTYTSWGDELYEDEDFEDAITKWQAYSGENDIDQRIDAAEYEIAVTAAKTGDFDAVVKANSLNLDNRARAAAEAFLIMPLNETVPIAASDTHIAYIDSTGKVHADGSNSHGQCNLENWHGVVSLYVSELNTYGLRYDGTVLATGSNVFGQCNVSSWKNIISLAATDNAVFGLTEDGKVVYAGGCEGWYDIASEWTSITEIAAGMEHVAALDSSGNVYAAGKNHYGQLDVLEATEITAISCGPLSTILIKADSTAEIIGVGISLGESEPLNDVAVISSSWSHIVVQHSDGHVSAYGENGRSQCEVSKWENILFFTARANFTVGVKTDGSVLTTVDGHTLDWQVFVWN